jgi:wobble nucleotide-excising tRNase
MSPEEAAEEAKKLKIETLEKKLKGAKEALKDTEDANKILAINKNLSAMADALNKLKESLEFGMDPELFELELWAIEAACIMLERQIETDFYDHLYD